MSSIGHIYEAHGAFDAVARAYLPSALIVSLVSISSSAGGQMLLWDEGIAATEVARRLRIAADAIDGGALAASAATDECAT